MEEPLLERVFIRRSILIEHFHSQEQQETQQINKPFLPTGLNFAWSHPTPFTQCILRSISCPGLSFAIKMSSNTGRIPSGPNYQKLEYKLQFRTDIYGGGGNRSTLTYSACKTSEIQGIQWDSNEIQLIKIIADFLIETTLPDKFCLSLRICHWNVKNLYNLLRKDILSRRKFGGFA